MDKTPSEQPKDRSYSYDSGSFELDHAREEFVRQLGTTPLGSAETRWVLYALGAFGARELEAISSLLSQIRRDGPL